MAKALAPTRVGVLGTGEVGRRLAAGFQSRGHDVMIGSRDPDKPELKEWLDGDGDGVTPGTFAQAAAHRRGSGRILPDLRRQPQRCRQPIRNDGPGVAARK